MNVRQEELLFKLTEAYLTTADPVSSGLLAHKAGFSISSATIRNELVQLEEEGFLYQPHTSAGRIPTLKGIERYIAQVREAALLSEGEQVRLEAIFKHDGLRGLAKEAAAYCKAAAVVARNGNDFYYTGFSNLFSAPECSNAQLVRAVSRSIDALEDALPQFIESGQSSSPKLYLGKHNPLGADCAVMFIGDGKHAKTLVGIISMVRTNYKKNMAVLKSISQYL
ncbi:MAG: hypothetical protein A3B30_03760 [Candidatus Komeilibacteria bacterium RIFCSPLOWO2_01_FULL_52_15]|uniref:Heat-inducible transcription repressor HrcA C-terminal domain-containing protein n=2 Tax=Candidatus Komeiliibacteriota TaxID=1817908 RepID=A0A1G2BQY8_9BACT|nr:MAG: hypothetical protein A2677_03720 [Candidatus Komeilibacteria bacterium RIFCSPHIGHO2_01_FULL_52_14]OGY91563.1 MAG: hypothetical protein A3B30_03760 [Candidatus Komeilibacteria bacterium RIFCSPLOWO2_01_FULL_52_15]